MTSQLELDRRRVLAGLALGVGGTVLAACGGRAGAQVATACRATPTETRGPFPADGSNGGARPLNVLASDGIVRSDIRQSFAGMAGRADGVALELELTVADDAGCAPLRDRALYLWHNDAAGAYSLYDLPGANYLRGLQRVDAEGRVRFSSIVPGCYGGRYPHCHFEVFASAEAALRGEAPLLVSQLAFPEAQCRAIYRDDTRYGESLGNLDRLPLARDFVFRDIDREGAASQLLRLEGDPAGGYRGRATIALAA
ncbi:MAG TPA: intradiol ring-cleavage dioxygenase [Croceibacterium sp.]|nr:intradiol ring-cleavage dioxygenase [Croceibacterium sp.]